MKPDGVNMEATEPTEAVAAPPSTQENVSEQAASHQEDTAKDATSAINPKENGKPVAADPKVEPKSISNKPTAKSAGALGSNSRPGTASHRTVNDVKASNNASAATVKKAATNAKSAAGAVPKRPMGAAAAASSSVKSQTRVPDKKPVGQARTTSVASTVTNGTKPTTVNGTAKKRAGAETVSTARPKTTATTSRPLAFTATKPSTSVTAKAGAAVISKTPRPTTGSSTSQPASAASRPTSATSKPFTNSGTAKTAASRVTTAPSTGKTTAAPPLKPSTAKKDVSRPPPGAGTKKPVTSTTNAAARKPEPSRPTATVKSNSASKLPATTKVSDPKVAQTKTQQPMKSTPTKKPVAALRFPAPNKPTLGRTPPASPANKPANRVTPQTKRGTKPTQAVSPFTATKMTQKTTTSVVETAGAAAATATAAAAAAAATVAPVVAERPTQSTLPLPHDSPPAESAPAEVPSITLSQDVTPEVVPEQNSQSPATAPSPLQSQDSPLQLESNPPLISIEEQVPAAAEPPVPPAASLKDQVEECVDLLTDQTTKAAESAPALIVSPTNLNEEEDEEEREGSQVVSVSEMSGTTQPTEESRPGSAGPVGGAAWRAGGALLSELDSEEVSGSQQGASELSAPGVLEGTESMDDLGEGSFKGVIDMEGASAGSPDFEKVPDIPVNDFDEEDDEDDDNDRVCDMDVGSERADEPQRPRDDNEVDEEEDEDVEMASEGVTESGLESYGNPDEDDFVEDERLDNLNRVAQPPPPPPQLPSAPAAQWDQPNPFANPWAEPLQPAQVEGAGAATPLAEPWQADSETPTQTHAQAWLELDSGPFASGNQEAPHQSSARGEPSLVGAQMYMAGSSAVPVPVPAPASAAGMSLSSTLSSGASTPEELRKFHLQDVQAVALSSQHDLDSQNLAIHMERGDGEEEEEAEAETLPADEVLGGPATAPTSNPSSSSVTEDEASDTEGEAQLEDSLESPLVSHVTFDCQPAAQRCLSTVEEGEEAEIEVLESVGGEDTTPPSATSLASYGFDTITTASSSNAQSAGESCIKSPGIFSLEELPEEPKEAGVIPELNIQPCLSEQQYIECGSQESKSAEHAREEEAGLQEAPKPLSSASTLQQAEENPDDSQPPYYSAICEKTENSFTGFTALPHPHRRDHAANPRTYSDIIKPHCSSLTPPKLTCADLPPRSLGQQALSPQLRRLEQHQRQLLELQHRREQQSRPLEEAEQERKRREEEEQRRKKEEAEEEIKRNREEERKRQEQAEVTRKEEEEKLRKQEELKQRRDLELQLQQQQEDLKQRQQIMQWQQELQQSNKGQTALLSPSSGLCTIYEALENSDDDDEVETEEEGIGEMNLTAERPQQKTQSTEREREKVASQDDKHQESSETPLQHALRSLGNPSQDGDLPSPCPSESPEQSSPPDLDWGKKVDIVQQLINQTLLLNRDGCSSMLLLPGGAGGTLSPLESSLWPSLLPPLTPPSATVTSVSSFSPETTGTSPQGEWTVVELETHH